MDKPYFLSSESMKWFRQMVDTYHMLSDEDKEILENWEKENTGKPSSEWPGWRKFIGVPPWILREN